LRVPCPSSLVGTRDGLLGKSRRLPLSSIMEKGWLGDAESGICVFQPHWQVQYPFVAGKLRENQNGSTDFSNIYYWLELVNWKWRCYPVSQLQVILSCQWLRICQMFEPHCSFCSWIEPPPNFRPNHVNPKTTNP
jgi:hypothetical protein